MIKDEGERKMKIPKELSRVHRPPGAVSPQSTAEKQEVQLNHMEADPLLIDERRV